jgi:hypothetical protein
MSLTARVMAGAADEDSLFTSQPESAEAGVELRSRKIAAADKAVIDKEVGASTRRVSLDSKPVGIYDLAHGGGAEPEARAVEFPC